MYKYVYIFTHILIASDDSLELLRITHPFFEQSLVLYLYEDLMISVYIYVHINICIHICIHTYTHRYIYICIYIGSDIFVQMYM